MGPGRRRATPSLLSGAKRTTAAEYKELIDGGRKPQYGDLIVSRNATVGAAAFVDLHDDFCMGQDVCLITSRDSSQRYLVYQLRSEAVTQQIDSLVVGATFNRINVEQIKALIVAHPPRDEQDGIAEFLDREAERIGAVIAKIESSIALLREYRTALISAAVTGKIDVRGEVAFP